MLKIFDESIKLEKGVYGKVTETISADRVSYRQVKMWGGIDLPIIT